MREEDLKATFGALHGLEAPVRAFEADDVIRRGERVRRNRRTFAVVGSGLATVAAVAAALLLLPVGGAPSEPVGPARSPSSVLPTSPPSTQPTMTAEPQSSQPVEPSSTASPEQTTNEGKPNVTTSTTTSQAVVPQLTRTTP